MAKQQRKHKRGEGTATTGRAAILCPTCRDMGNIMSHKGCPKCGRTRPRKQMRRILRFKAFPRGKQMNRLTYEGRTVS